MNMLAAGAATCPLALMLLLLLWRQGILLPYGSNGTRFQIDFNPSEYGKYYEADLIIDTDEMQWIYRCGTMAPSARSTYGMVASGSKPSSRCQPRISQRLHLPLSLLRTRLMGRTILTRFDETRASPALHAAYT